MGAIRKLRLSRCEVGMGTWIVPVQLRMVAVGCFEVQNVVHYIDRAGAEEGHS